MKTNPFQKITLLRAAIGTGTLLLSSQLHAAVTTGAAGGIGLDVNVSALSLVSLDVGPLAQAQVNSPAPNTTSAGVLSVNQSVLLGSVAAQNGVDNAIVASATTNVTGVATSGLAIGSATTNNLGITLIPGVLFTPDFLTLSSSTIGSTSTSSGQFGALGSSGSTVLENLAISVTGINITIPVNPAPNTVLVLAGLGLNADIVAGLSIILNEQITTGNGTSATGITTNALRISITALNVRAVTGLDGDIIVGQSTSSLTAVPEPSYLAALLGGPALLILRRRRQS